MFPVLKDSEKRDRRFGKNQLHHMYFLKKRVHFYRYLNVSEENLMTGAGDVWRGFYFNLLYVKVHSLWKENLNTKK